jgi:hypothetical protein
MLYSGFKTFSEKALLLESAQEAKAYLIKKYAESKNMKSSEVPEEIKQRIVNDPRFIEVRDLCQKFPNYIALFTKFVFDQKAPIDRIKHIIEMMLQYKTNLAKDLEMQIQDYGKITATKEDIRPGWEVLEDDLNNIPRKIKLRRLYNGLTPEMKLQFNKASEKEIAHLEEISNQLDRLPNKEGEDEKGNMVTKNAWDEFTGNVKKYTDTRTYPEYRDPRVAFLDLIKDADLKIAKWDESDDEFVTNLKKLGAQVGILYSKKGYTVLSARTPEALRAVAGDTGWCIRNDSTFWSYSGSSPDMARMQFVVVDKNLPTTNPNSLLGITVYGDGRIYTDADRPNRRIYAPNGSTFKTLNELMKGLNFPNDLIDEVNKKFEVEKNIKVSLEQFFKLGKKLNAEEIIKSLINAKRGVLSGIVDPEQWDQISGIVSMIIAEAEDLKPSHFLEEFRTYGILTKSSVGVFDYVVGDDYTKKDIDKIIDATKQNQESARDFLMTYRAGFGKVKAEHLALLEEIERDEAEVLKALESKL